jgi:hypothetical protein
MDSMDSIRERFEALERRIQMVEQRLRWWRGITCGVVMLSLLSLALPSGKAADTQPRGMAARMTALEDKLAAMAFDAAANEVVITGVNLRIVVWGPRPPRMAWAIWSWGTMNCVRKTPTALG